MKTCAQCQSPFEVTDQDRVFYQKINVPEPTFCPDCRQQRRLAWRNERTLYLRKCNLCDMNIVSIYSPEKNFTTYCSKCWWGDQWDGINYGQDFDFSRPFFEQFIELNKKAPKLTLINDNNSRSINCEYTNDFAFGKNCYFVFCSWYQEFCLYSNFANRTNFSSDVTACLDGELLYECIDCDHCHHSAYLFNSSSSHDCYFSYDLKNCSNCFFCHGLRGKNFYIKNKPYSKEEYEEKMNEIDLGSYQKFQEYKKAFLNILPTISRKNMNLKNCIDCKGDFLINSKNTLGYDFVNAEDSKYIYVGDTAKTSYDISSAGHFELCYESVTCDDSYQSLFTIFSWKNRFVTYTNDCHSCQDCFGCVSLKNKKYCILNKQYSKDDYETLILKIIEHMKKMGEWGEFFPINMSPFGYNETLANEYYPLKKEEALSKGWKWSDYEQPNPKVEKTIPAERLPDSIDDIPDDILNWAITCEVTGRPYKIMKQELQFYRNFKLSVPHLHPDERHKNRMKLRAPRKLFPRQCDQCGVKLETTYAPDREEKVYCEHCYLKKIY